MVTSITQGQLLALHLGRMKDDGTMTPAAGVDGEACERRHGV